MVRSWERDGCSGGKLDLVWTFMVCIDDSAWFLKAWLCLSRFTFLVIFGAFSWRFSCGSFETFLFEIWWGVYAWTLHGSCPCDSPPKSVGKGARFWGFPMFWERGVLGGNPSISLDSISFGWPNRSYGMTMRYSYYPQSLVLTMEEIRRSGFGFGGVDPQVVVHLELPRPDRSDRCMWMVWSV
jgi:hypothetical protein